MWARREMSGDHDDCLSAAALLCGRSEPTLIQKHTTKTGHESRRLYHMPISRVRSLIVGEIGVLLPLENRGDSTTGPRDKSNSDKRLITLEDKWDIERGKRTHVDLMTSVRSSWSLQISCAIHDQPDDILPHQIEAPL